MFAEVLDQLFFFPEVRELLTCNLTCYTLRHHLSLKSAQYKICSDLQKKLFTVVATVLATVNENTTEAG